MLSKVRPKIRNTLGPLRDHKKRHNFADTQSEICECNQGLEDTWHILFYFWMSSLCVMLLEQYWQYVIEILQRTKTESSRKWTWLESIRCSSLDIIDNRNVVVNNKIYQRHQTVLNLRSPPPLSFPCFGAIVFIFCFVYFLHSFYCIDFPCCYCKFLDCHSFGLIFLPSFSRRKKDI